MSETPRHTVLVRLLENILTLTGISVGLSSLIYFSAGTLPEFPVDVARQLSLLTIVYHSVVLILSRFRSIPTNTPNYYDHDSHLIIMTVFIAKKTGFGAEVGTLKFVRIWLPSSL